MRLRAGARVAVIGAGPSGLVVAKHALEAGMDPVVFEASDDLGGQWHTTAAHSGMWPGLQANTSRAMTAFSDFPAPEEHPLHPSTTQVHAYLRAYAEHFGVVDLIRWGTTVRHVELGWTVDGEPFDGVVLATGRFRRPHVPATLASFGGDLLHAFDYPGAAALADRATLVVGNGVSGLEIAADLAPASAVVSACRKPRYVIRKNVDGVSSDWQWYTAFGALERRLLPREELGRRLRDRVLRVAGNPADYGAPRPDADILVAGLSLCQDYLAEVQAGRIVCRPDVVAIDGRDVTFADGTRQAFDVLICATGYDPDIPYLGADVRTALGSAHAMYRYTLHPDLPGLGVIGQFLLQGPYFPLLELQARWIVGLFAGDVVASDRAAMRHAMAEPRPPIELHHVMAEAFASELGVAPVLRAHPELAEPLLFGPLLGPRYRLDGPGAQPEARERFERQLALSPRAAVDPADIAALERFGLGDVADGLVDMRT